MDGEMLHKKGYTRNYLRADAKDATVPEGANARCPRNAQKTHGLGTASFGSTARESIGPAGMIHLMILVCLIVTPLNREKALGVLISIKGPKGVSGTRKRPGQRAAPLAVNAAPAPRRRQRHLAADATGTIPPAASARASMTETANRLLEPGKSSSRGSDAGALPVPQWSQRQPAPTALPVPRRCQRRPAPPAS